MRTVISAITLVLVLSLPTLAEDLPTDSPEQLMERLTAAIGSRDAGALDRLHYWEGVDPAHADALRESFETRFFECNARPAGVVPGQFGTEEFVRGGQRYVPNLEIEGRIDFRCTTDRRGSFQVPYGRLDGQYYLVNVTRMADNPAAR